LRGNQFSYGFADPEAPSDGQWVAIDFHRDPHCPEILDFNLLMFVDVPSSLVCALTVDVKEWWSTEDLAVTAPWQNPPWSPDFRTPSQARWLGRGAVPVYFVNLLEYVDAIGDGVLTVAELEGLPSVLIGHATKYQYVQLNSGRANSHPRYGGHSWPHAPCFSCRLSEDGEELEEGGGFLTVALGCSRNQIPLRM
jgi:hypothetical protein